MKREDTGDSEFHPGRVLMSFKEVGTTGGSRLRRAARTQFWKFTW